MRFKELLVEANIFNLSNEYVDDTVGHSIPADQLRFPSVNEFVNQCIPENSNVQVQQWYLKVLRNYFINNPDLHLRCVPAYLPDHAPAWAKAASAKGELYLFVSGKTNKDEIDHIGHFLIALQAAAEAPIPENSPNRDVLNQRKVEAERTLRSLQTMSYDNVVQKSNEYFSKGTKKAKLSGDFKPIFNFDDGWKWLLLASQEAYEMAGKVLQNCIGSIYRYNKYPDQEIFILVDPAENAHAAARVNNQITDELKGKQNKSPELKYKNYVVPFLKKYKPSEYMRNDLYRMGLTIYDNELTEISDLNKYVTTKVLDEGDDSTPKVILFQGPASPIQKIMISSYRANFVDGDIYPVEKKYYVVQDVNTEETLYIFRTDPKTNTVELFDSVNLLKKDVANNPKYYLTPIAKYSNEHNSDRMPYTLSEILHDLGLIIYANKVLTIDEAKRKYVTTKKVKTANQFDLYLTTGPSEVISPRRYYFSENLAIGVITANGKKVLDFVIDMDEREIHKLKQYANQAKSDPLFPNCLVKLLSGYRIPSSVSWRASRGSFLKGLQKYGLVIDDHDQLKTIKEVTGKLSNILPNKFGVTFKRIDGIAAYLQAMSVDPTKSVNGNYLIQAYQKDKLLIEFVMAARADGTAISVRYPPDFKVTPTIEKIYELMLDKFHFGKPEDLQRYRDLGMYKDKSVILKKDGNAGKILLYINTHKNVTRTELYQDLLNWSAAGTPGFMSVNAMDYMLFVKGLIDVKRTKSYYIINITKKGKSIAAELKKTGKVVLAGDKTMKIAPFVPLVEK